MSHATVLEATHSLRSFAALFVGFASNSLPIDVNRYVKDSKANANTMVRALSHVKAIFGYQLQVYGAAMKLKKTMFTDEQVMAILSEVLFKILVGGAGTGKTAVLLEMIRLQIMAMAALDTEEKNQKILVLSFSKRTVEDFELRLSRLLPSEEAEKVEVKTLHAFGHRLIRKHYKKLGYKQMPTLKDNDEEKREISALFKNSFDGISLHAKAKEMLLNLLLASIAHDVKIKARLSSYKQLLCHADRLIAIKNEYLGSKIGKSTATFYDQILGPRKLFKEYREEVLEEIGGKYCMLLVDEFQDLSPVQFEIVRDLASVIKRVTVVGDDAQTIYSFLGANPKSLGKCCNWRKDAKLFKLTKSFRCSRQILELANGIRQNIVDVTSASLTSERKEPGFLPRYVSCDTKTGQDWLIKNLIMELVNRRNLEYQDITVLSRSNKGCLNIYRYLKRMGLPAIYGSEELCTRVCSMLKAWFRVIYKGNKESDVTELMEALNLGTSYDEVQAVLKQKKGIFKKLDYLVERLKLAGGSGYVEEILDLGKECINYYMGDGKDKVIAYVEQIRTRVRNCKRCAEVERVISQFNETHDENCITVQTMHGSKGLEYKAVIIVDMADGEFPDYRTLDNPTAFDEERRLLYVAVTRAKKYLCLVGSPYVDYNPYRKGKKDREVRKCSLFTKELRSKCKLLERREKKKIRRL